MRSDLPNSPWPRQGDGTEFSGSRPSGRPLRSNRLRESGLDDSLESASDFHRHFSTPAEPASSAEFGTGIPRISHNVLDAISTIRSEFRHGTANNGALDPLSAGNLHNNRSVALAPQNNTAPDPPRVRTENSTPRLTPIAGWCGESNLD